jgi:hypothetical protein
MYDVIKGFGRRMSLPKYLSLEDDMRTYLALIIVDAIRVAGDTLIYPEGLKLDPVDVSDFLDKKACYAATHYDPTGGILGITGGGRDEEAERAKEDLSKRKLEKLRTEMDEVKRSL